VYKLLEFKHQDQYVKQAKLLDVVVNKDVYQLNIYSWLSTEKLKKDQTFHSLHKNQKK
jgi:hypothetical protein